MTKYDNLDAHTQLEQSIAKELLTAFGKRGFTVKHNGTPETPAKSGMPDIEMWTTGLHVNVEVTKTTKSSRVLKNGLYGSFWGLHLVRWCRVV